MNTTRSTRVLFLPLALLPLACGGTDAPTTAATRDVRLTFAASVGGAPVACDRMYEGLGANGARAQLADARLFVSEVELRDPDGVWVPLELTDSDWQQRGVALLDFEDGEGACADSGTPETNFEVRGVAPDRAYTGARFTVGVPFALNHNDNASAGAPFDVPGMFWNWRGGYKFVRVDWAVDGGAIARWNVHLGTTMCVSDSPATAPSEDCGRSNRARVVLDELDPDADAVQLDLAALVGAADLVTNVPDSPPGCMSNPMEGSDCAPVFSALGLDFTNGGCVDGCAAQAVFRAP